MLTSRFASLPGCSWKAVYTIIRKKSSKDWLLRHFSDPYVHKARFENYRARSAFKLLEIQEKFSILKPGLKVLDCGASPGAWSQVAVKHVNALGKDPFSKRGIVCSIDILPIQPIPGAIVLSCMDFSKKENQEKIVEYLQSPLDLVMSDMAPNVCGINSLDHERSIQLAWEACVFAIKNLKRQGNLLFKLFPGGGEANLVSQLKQLFNKVNIIKPDASRKESGEIYVLCQSFSKAATE